MKKVTKKLNKNDIESVLSLSPLQKGILFHYLLDKETDLYLEQLKMMVKGRIDETKFQKAWEAVIENNEVLRTTFRWEEVKNPIQVVMKSSKVNISYHDYTDTAILPEVEKILERDRQCPFELDEIPFRVSLHRLNSDSYMILVTHHHILYDGWSNGILINEFLELYHTIYNGEYPAVKEKGTFGKYIKWINQQTEQEKNNYWADYLADYTPKTFELSPQQLKDNQGEGKIEQVTVSCSQNMTEQLAKFAQQNSITLANVLFGAWGILLFHYYNDTDVVFGTTVSTRPSEIPGIQKLVGLCINTIPVRINAQANERISDFLINLGQSQRLQKEFETMPLPAIIGVSEANQDEELFQSLFIFENYPIDKTSFHSGSGFTVESFEYKERSNYNLTITASHFNEGLEVAFQYNKNMFSPESIQKMGEYYINILYEILEKYDQPLSAIHVLGQVERDKILIGFNDKGMPAAQYSLDQCIHRIFEEKVKANPDNMALVQGDRSVTYKQLNEQANKLARKISEEIEVLPNSAIGIMVSPSIEMVLGILSILKAGAAFVPLDPNGSSYRNTEILQMTQTELILTTSEIEHALVWGGKTVYINDEIEQDTGNLENRVSPEYLAYIMFTSGSTGKPKGILLAHYNLVNTLSAQQAKFPVTDQDTWLLKTNYTFDVSLTEIMGWFVGMGRLGIAKIGFEKEPAEIVKAISSYQVSHINFSPSMFHFFVEYLYRSNSVLQKISSLRYIFLAGEALKTEIAERFKRLNTNILLVDAYGPTEAAIYATYCELDGDQYSIGKPISNMHAYILDKHRRIQPIGLAGELYLSGAGLFQGYLNQPIETSMAKIKNHFINELTLKETKSENHYNEMYKTGDIVRWSANGTIEYLGRNDHMVKIRGHRVEIEEIENILLKYRNIDDVVVIAKKDQEQNLYLCAFYTSREEVTADKITSYLRPLVHSYMIPSLFLRLKEIPLLPSGKVDVKTLQRMEIQRPELSVTYEAPRAKIHKQIYEIWKNTLQIEKIGVRDNFFDLGGDSLKLIKVRDQISETLNKEIAATVLFQYPTIQSLSEYLLVEHLETERQVPLAIEQQSNHAEGSDDRIAVVGMSCRFPESDNIMAFWDNLFHGRECIRFFNDEELIARGVKPELVADPAYVKAQGVMSNSDCFDAEFFAYTPREAEIMDPQMRVYHEVVWEALEDSGYLPFTDDWPITGLFSSASPNLFWEALVVLSGKNRILGDFTSEQLMNKDYISSRLSYKMNFTGPTISSNTACSSSLVSVHLACESILRGECDLAVAGSITISPLPDQVGYLYMDGMIKSPDGHCRAFDENAQGFIGGTGSGAVVLKRLSAAQESGDHIYAIIKGSAVNNDGSNRAGYTAPSVDGQKKAIHTALRRAGVTPESISYVEAHGTATPLGDSVEVEALRQAYQSPMKNYCGLGSVKSNIGHLDCTAGIAGMIKTSLALKHRKLPPTLHVTAPNSSLKLIDSPFYLPTELAEWKGEGPLRAAVSSLGLGGVNAHLIMEEAPEVTNQQNEELNAVLLLLSAKTEEALSLQAERLKQYLMDDKHINLEDVAYTLQKGRCSFTYRRAFVCESIEQALEQLDGDHNSYVSQENEEKMIVLQFSRLDVSAFKVYVRIYQQEHIFREAFDRISGRLDFKISKQWDQEELFHMNAAAKMYMDFCLSYAMVKLVMSRGISPSYISNDYIGDLMTLLLSIEQAEQDIAGIIALIQLRLSILNDEVYDNSMSKNYLLELENILSNVDCGELEIPCLDTQNNSVLTAHDFKSPAYWMNNTRLSNASFQGVENSVILQLGGPTSENGSHHSLFLLGDMETSNSNMLLGVLGKLWLIGCKIEWSRLHTGHQRRRVSLPTYPFARNRYWIEGNPFTTEKILTKSDITKNPNMEDWFYTPVWKQAVPLPIVDSSCEENMEYWLIFGNEQPYVQKLILELGRAGNIILVMNGDTVQQKDAKNYTIRAHVEKDYVWLLEEIKKTGVIPNRILFLWGISDVKESNQITVEGLYQDIGFFSLLYMSKALLYGQSEERFSIVVVDRHMYSVNGERPNPAKSLILGPCKVIPQEISFISCRAIDIGDSYSEKECERLAKQLRSEISESNAGSPSIVAYRHNCRYLQEFSKVSLPSKKTEGSSFRQGGVYIVTGGLGKIGFQLAQHMAATSNATLILVGRSYFPPKDNWEMLLRIGDDSNPYYKKIETMMKLEQTGARFFAVQGDVADIDVMRKIVTDAEGSFGAINGVLHAAGEMSTAFQTIEQLKVEDCLSQFAPKINGLLNLYEIFKEKELDFLMVTSSTSAILGGLGFAAYSAANIVMDSIIAMIRRSQDNEGNSTTQWISVNWEGWEFDDDIRKYAVKTSMDALMLSPEEGTSVFEQVLEHPEFGQLVISSGDLNSRINQWLDMNISKKLNSGLTEKKGKKIKRSASAGTAAMPASKLEMTIAHIFEEFLGYEGIGVDDNFFDLGATSLDMIQITEHLRKALGRNVPILKLFMFSTIRTLVAELTREVNIAKDEELTNRPEATQVRRNDAIMQRYQRRKPLEE